MKIYLAPMEGVIDACMRDTLSRIGGYEIMVTEFVRVTKQLLPKKTFYKYCPELLTEGKTSSGTPVRIQLLGGDANLVAENAHLASELGSPGIDLNFGCPAKTVNRHDGGATLLKNPQRVFDVISAVRRALPADVPVSAKVRLGFDHTDFACDIARMVQAAGAERLVVHARTKADGYRPPAHWQFIRLMKEAAPGLHIVANGEVWNLDDFARCKQESQCEDIALGRGALADPYLAHKILASELTGSVHDDEFFREHFLYFVKVSEQLNGQHFALCRAKQWLSYLGLKDLEFKNKFQQIKTMKTLNEFYQFVGSDNKVDETDQTSLRSASHLPVRAQIEKPYLSANH